MVEKHVETLIANLSGPVRTEWRGGIEYRVAPVTMIVPGVLNGSAGPIYYPEEEVTKNPESWNGIPLTVYHPTNGMGGMLSARDPDVYERQGVGRVYYSRKSIDNATGTGKLVAEAWFEVEAVRRVDPRVLDYLEVGKRIEVSTGLRAVRITAQEGSEYKGRAYHSIAVNYEPDHLAILPDQVGACSVADGCGILVNQSGWGPVMANIYDREPVTARTVSVSQSAVWSAKPEIYEVANAYDMSYDDKRQALMLQLYKRFGDAWLSEMYADHIIYARGEDYYRLDYSEDQDGVCTLSDAEPKKVKRYTVYEPVSNLATPVAPVPVDVGYRRIDMALTPQQRDQVIGELVTNCECWRNDRDLLSTFADDKLVQLHQHAAREIQMRSVANAAVRGFADSNGVEYRINPDTGKWEQRPQPVKQGQQGNEPNPQPTQNQQNGQQPVHHQQGQNQPQPGQPAVQHNHFQPAPMQPAQQPVQQPPAQQKPSRAVTVDDYMVDVVRGAPDGIRVGLENMMSEWREARSIIDREKDKIISEILVNVAEHDRAGQRERLQRRSLDDLRGDLALLPRVKKTEDGRGGMSDLRQIINDSQDCDVLSMPEIQWHEVANADDTGKQGQQNGQGQSVSDIQPRAYELVSGMVNDDEMLRRLPAAWRDRMQNALAVEARERQTLIKEITAGITDEDGERRLVARLQNKSLDELRDLAALAPKKDQRKPDNYFGSSTPVSLGNRSTSADDDVLPLPKMNWSD